MNISRLHFAHLPTLVEALPRLSQALGGPGLLIKRDDQTGGQPALFADKYANKI